MDAAGFVGTRGHHAHSVVHRELLIRGIEIGIVAAGAAHCRFRVIGYRQSRHPSGVLPDPIRRQALTVLEDIVENMVSALWGAPCPRQGR